MAKELIIDKYVLLTDRGINLDEKKEIILLSDIHIGKNFNNKYSNKVITLLEKYLETKENIDSIVIPGDHVNGARSYLNNEYMSLFKYLLEMFSQKSPVILSRGNHDLWNENDDITRIYKDLEKIPNVYPLDNEQLKIEGINYTGFSPRFEAYQVMKKRSVVNNMFVEDYLNEHFNYDVSNLNIDLIHDPSHIASMESLNRLKEDLSKINLIVSGHMHNGYIPDNIEYLLSDRLSDMGFSESPYTGFKTDMCRGAYFLGKNSKGTVILPNKHDKRIINGLDKKDRALLVVTKGISKYPLSYFDGNPSITEITVQGPNYIDKEEKGIRNII